ncbi:MAG: LysM peptidoglycan-binding domain-containing protein [Verrucomicrobiota bacterium]|nr:LysM peptidoglycan-binding domain-containing protein [Verrucomicrobiota bacterium]
MLINLVKRKRTATFSVLLVVLVYLCLSQVSGNAKNHTIAKGETLGIIAKKYGLTISELAKHNGISNPNRVKVGQKINIPENSVSINYTVKRGDTLSSIAKKHQTTPNNISKTNNISDPRKLKPGQKLKIIKGNSSKSNKPKSSSISTDVITKIDRPRVRRGRWKHIVVHHSGDNTNSIKGMEHYHRRVRRMENGLAYHFVIGNGVNTGDGKIYIGDRWSRQIRGGHVASTALNEIAIGICLVGNFDKRTPTLKQRSSLRALVYKLRQRTGISHKEVRSHRNINPKPTACPGRQFNLRGILN